MLSSIISSVWYGQSGSPKFNITVIDSDGKRISVSELEKPKETVADFKHRVAGKIRIPAEQQALIVNDRYVSNDTPMAQCVSQFLPVTQLIIAWHPEGHQNQ